MASTALAGTSAIVEHGEEQRLFLDNISWDDYLKMSSAVDDRPAIRLSYLRGQLEIMTTSHRHELLKKMIARLVEAYALVHRLSLVGIGSATFRRKVKERGLEPDECYCLGELRKVPDLAIEVVVSRGVINKLAIYAGLGVGELWAYEGGAFLVFRRVDDESYEQVERSELLPAIDLERLAHYVERTDQSEAVREYIEALGGLR